MIIIVTWEKKKGKNKYSNSDTEDEIERYNSSGRSTSPEETEAGKQKEKSLQEKKRNERSKYYNMEKDEKIIEKKDFARKKVLRWGWKEGRI